ncbi:MAG: TetR/AcrR family transcriptional regulator [Actinomycetota bacterium]|nr:TetR/AcrR family transcriptional regulator [Actinomycetota bacterium]
MSTGYETGGRARQKQRTRGVLVAAARQLVTDGLVPTVDAVAERSGISRTTAYRYFPNQTSLLSVAHPEVQAVSLLTEPAETDVAKRLDDVVRQFTRLIVDTEPQQRTMLRLSLTEGPAELPLRQGRAIGWISEALEPLRTDLTDPQLHRLVIAIRATIGIEALVWLVDVAGLSRTEAAQLMRRSAAALLADALR